MISISHMGAIAAGRPANTGALTAEVVLSCSCAGSVVDESIYHHVFTRYGGATFNPDPALVMAVIADYVQAPASTRFAFGTGDFDISFDGKKTANCATGYDIALSTDNSAGSGTNGWFVELSTVRGFCLVSDGLVQMSSTGNIINDGLYHTWRIARVSGVASMYRDGVLLNSQALTKNFTAAGPMSLGHNSVCMHYPFNGAMRNVVIRRPGYAG